MSEKLTVCFIPKIEKEGHAINQISTITPKINGCYGGYFSLNVIFGVFVAVLVKLWYDENRRQ